MKQLKFDVTPIVIMFRVTAAKAYSAVYIVDR